MGFSNSGDNDNGDCYDGDVSEAGPGGGKAISVNTHISITSITSITSIDNEPAQDKSGSRYMSSGSSCHKDGGATSL